MVLINIFVFFLVFLVALLLSVINDRSSCHPNKAKRSFFGLNLIKRFSNLNYLYSKYHVCYVTIMSNPFFSCNFDFQIIFL